MGYHGQKEALYFLQCAPECLKPFCRRGNAAIQVTPLTLQSLGAKRRAALSAVLGALQVTAAGCQGLLRAHAARACAARSEVWCFVCFHRIMCSSQKLVGEGHDKIGGDVKNKRCSCCTSRYSRAVALGKAAERGVGVASSLCLHA